MRITRIAADGEGKSVLEEVDIEFNTMTVPGTDVQLGMSRGFASPDVTVIDVPPGLDADLHPVPQRQLVAVLSGTLEIGTPDGERREFGPGSFLLGDDVGAEGHSARAIGGRVVFLRVPVPEDGPIPWSV